MSAAQRPAPPSFAAAEDPGLPAEFGKCLPIVVEI